MHGFAFLCLVLLAGCQRNEGELSGGGPATSTLASTSTEPGGTIAAGQQPTPGDRVDVHGIVVEYLDGGAIKISGRDRWGEAFDTTYENHEFLRKALPVLERSLSAEQVAGLRALLADR